MPKKIYVGNVSFKTTEEDLRSLFSQYGEVSSVNVITDRETGRPRGFAFVEMDGADAAISALDQKDFQGRVLTVNEARPRRDDRGGGGGGGGGRGGGGGGRSDRW